MICPKCNQEIELFIKTGSEGGKARAQKLSKERRVEIAKKAVRARIEKWCQKTRFVG